MFNWHSLWRMALGHRQELIQAHIVAFCATVLAVPVPLLMPLLVDEVLLEKPASLVSAMNSLFPEGWHGPVLYVVAILLLTLILRFGALLLTVWQNRSFTIIAKSITYSMRHMGALAVVGKKGNYILYNWPTPKRTRRRSSRTRARAQGAPAI